MIYTNLQKGIYIPSVDAKDIYLALNYIDGTEQEYTLKLKDGQYNLRKFINSFDFSLDLIELTDIYYKKFRRRDFAFKIKKHLYTTNVINITFKYAVRTWNQMNKNTLVKFGYNYRNLVFVDGIAKNNSGDIVGIKINEPIENIQDLGELAEYITIENDVSKKSNGTHKDTDIKYWYKQYKDIPALMSSADLRRFLYKSGFKCDGVHFCRLKRSTGSARVGKCLFANEPLFKPLLKFSSGGIQVNEGDEIDLAAYEGYIALTSSSIIDTIEIKPENILLIDDFESVFREDVIATRNIDGWLYTNEENCEIVNNIWDGQSLLDISMFGKYSKYGMILLRNLMFKSCCFNTNIQQWFKDNNITDVSQLNGKTIATKIEDIKLITTPSSIKYLKFDTFENWLMYMYPTFGVVKLPAHPHPPAHSASPRRERPRWIRSAHAAQNPHPADGDR